MDIVYLRKEAGGGGLLSQGAGNGLLRCTYVMFNAKLSRSLKSEKKPQYEYSLKKKTAICQQKAIRRFLSFIVSRLHSVLLLFLK